MKANGGGVRYYGNMVYGGTLAGGKATGSAFASVGKTIKNGVADAWHWLTGW